MNDPRFRTHSPPSADSLPVQHGAYPEPSRAGRLPRRAFVATSVLLLAPLPALGASRTRDIVRYDFPVQGTSLRAGAARTGVEAEARLVQEVVKDYRGYARFIEQFERSKVVGRAGSTTDLYLDIPILHGLTKIWAVLRFSEPTTEGGAQVIRGRMLKGNVRRLDVTWRVVNVEPAWAELGAELLLDLDLPAPRSSVLKTVKRAAAQAVRGVRAEAERRAKA